MGKRTHIVINGRTYDTATGLPIDHASQTRVTVHDQTVSHRVTVSHRTVKHQSPKLHHSTTLRRDVVAKPHGAHDHLAKQRHQHAHVTKSPAIRKFAPHPTQPHANPVVDKTSPIVAAVHQQHPAKHSAPKTAMTSRELKDHLVATKLAAATPNTERPAKKIRLHRPAKVSSVMAACFAVMLLGGYLTYINMPHLSVRVAASQAGVNASYPTYVPSGYRFDGPVAYSDGEVTLAFAGNGGNVGYRITEKRSTWDSQAVLDNLVAAKTSQYDTTASGGLTIYTYGGNAAWVNAGTLYTINGDAPLSPDQVIKIAQSL